MSDNPKKNECDWRKIEPHCDLKEELEKIVKDIHQETDETKREGKEEQAKSMMKLQLRYEETQRQIYQIRKSRERFTKIFDSGFTTRTFILVVAAISVAIAVVLFALMVMEFFEAFYHQEKRLESSIMSAIFGISGIGDIIVLMKYIMNRAQRALSDMIQTMLAVISFMKQTDAQGELLEQKDWPVDDFIKIIKSIQESEQQTMKNIENYVDKQSISDQSTLPKNSTEKQN